MVLLMLCSMRCVTMRLMYDFNCWAAPRFKTTMSFGMFGCDAVEFSWPILNFFWGDEDVSPSPGPIDDADGAATQSHGVGDVA